MLVTVQGGDEDDPQSVIQIRSSSWHAEFEKLEGNYLHSLITEVKVRTVPRKIERARTIWRGHELFGQ
jgi:hypothetical protein